jgi:lipopolysaccharide export system permease protein
VPAALLYAGYYVLLQVSRDLLSDGAVPPVIGLWWVHAVFFVIGVCVYKDLHLRARARGRI